MPGALQGIRARGILLFACAFVLTTPGSVANAAPGGPDGFHVLAASSRSGYAWYTAATLSEPGVETDRWIGNACLTGSGRRLVVVYGPRTFTNRPDLFERGGFTAVVDLLTGAVTKLALRTSLAYFNPGCGAGETAVLTQGRGEGLAATRLHLLDAASGRLRAPVTVRGQLTSAVPARGGIVAAEAGSLVQVLAGVRARRGPACSARSQQACHPSAGDVFTPIEPRFTQVERHVGGWRRPAPTPATATGRARGRR